MSTSGTASADCLSIAEWPHLDGNAEHLLLQLGHLELLALGLSPDRVVLLDCGTHLVIQVLDRVRAEPGSVLGLRQSVDAHCEQTRSERAAEVCALGEACSTPGPAMHAGMARGRLGRTGAAMISSQSQRTLGWFFSDRSRFSISLFCW